MLSRNAKSPPTMSRLERQTPFDIYQPSSLVGRSPAEASAIFAWEERCTGSYDPDLSGWGHRYLRDLETTLCRGGGRLGDQCSARDAAQCQGAYDGGTSAFAMQCERAHSLTIQGTQNEFRLIMGSISLTISTRPN